MFTKLVQTLARGSPKQSTGQVVVHSSSKCHYLRTEGAGESLALELLLTPDLSHYSLLEVTLPPRPSGEPVQSLLRTTVKGH